MSNSTSAQQSRNRAKALRYFHLILNLCYQHLLADLALKGKLKTK